MIEGENERQRKIVGKKDRVSEEEGEREGEERGK